MSFIKILLVDTDIIIRDSFSILLNSIPKVGVIKTLSNGDEVLPFLNFNKVDIIFTEIIMENINGFEITQEVKKQYPGVKVIGFSFNDDVSIKNKMKKCGADNFISKLDVNIDLIFYEINK